MNAPTETLNQHLIDPVICIRCNTCEDTCPVGAITHNDRNYVVNPEICNGCNACISPCPTGSIDNWRRVPRSEAYTVDEQFDWDELPEPVPLDDQADHGASTETQPLPTETVVQPQALNGANWGSRTPPWSAAHPYVNLYPPAGAAVATVAGNHRVTEVGREYDTHHIVLDFGTTRFPVLEGQSIGIIPPGTDAHGRPHHARQYSVASPRNGERAGYNNLALTIKRVLEDHQGHPVRGVASNYLCDLKVGDTANVIGPFGTSFLMPNHPRANIVMICTGTGSAPMRAMTEWRRRERAQGRDNGGQLMLFFGARSRDDLPYFGPLMKLPQDFIDIHFAFSRDPNEPKRYVQEVMHEHAAELAHLLNDPDTYLYVCGLKAMEEGVLLALRSIAEDHGMPWATLGQSLRDQGRLHLETY